MTKKKNVKIIDIIRWYKFLTIKIDFVYTITSNLKLKYVVFDLKCVNYTLKFTDKFIFIWIFLVYTKLHKLSKYGVGKISNKCEQHRKNWMDWVQ
jgi:hypothetical protein